MELMYHQLTGNAGIGTISRKEELLYKTSNTCFVHQQIVQRVLTQVVQAI